MNQTVLTNNSGAKWFFFYKTWVNFPVSLVLMTHTLILFKVKILLFKIFGLNLKFRNKDSGKLATLFWITVSTIWPPYLLKHFDIFQILNNKFFLYLITMISWLHKLKIIFLKFQIWIQIFWIKKLSKLANLYRRSSLFHKKRPYILH